MSLIDRLFRLSQRREGAAERGSNKLMSSLRNVQQQVYQSFLERLTRFTFGSGQNLTAGNIQQVNSFAASAELIFTNERPTFAQRLFDRVTNLFGLNRRHFELVAPNAVQPTLSAEQAVLASYGLDPATGAILPGSYLDNALGNSPIASAIGQLLRAALADPDATAESVRQQFYAAFINPSGLGILERHYFRFINDLFMQVDRQVQYFTAQELGYQHFVYAGTAVRDSRSFCLKRLNLVYTLDFAQGWNSQQWAGKIPNVPFLQQQGGYNCRHTLMFVSPEIAQQIARQAGKDINSYR